MEDTKLTLLPSEFEGKGEVKGSVFTLLKRGKNAMMFQRKMEDVDKLYYEVFKRKITNKYDFENQVPLEEKTETYPKSNSFGVNAWCFADKEKAFERFEGLENNNKQI
jgi:hypothetical protein